MGGRTGYLPEPGERELRALADIAAARNVSDAMKAAWLREARNDDWRAEQQRLREAEWVRLKAEAREANTYRAGGRRRA